MSDAPPGWDPDLYHRFREERARPFDDLLALLDDWMERTVLDLGCGTGELTRRLGEHLELSEVTGIDSSPEMLARAKRLAGPFLRFEQRRIEDVTGSWDVIVSNAALHWVEDHETLIPRLWSHVNPGGQLAVQVPSNHDHVSQRIVRELAAAEPFRSALGGWSRTSPVLPADRYAEILHGLGGEAIAAYEKVYPHVLPDADAVVDWIRGTTLRPYLARFDDATAPAFLDACRERMREAMPGAPVFFGFRRILFAATRP